MKSFLLPFILLFALEILHAQTYTIPGATEQPAWVFPLWFEDGTGAKDTIYFGYDINAKNGSVDVEDIIYGEGFIILDTSLFFICWGFPYSDTLGIKIQVFKDISIMNYITFYKAQFPVKIKWDDNLFYNAIIPYPDNGDLPRAWALFGCHDYSPEYPNCFPLGDLPLLFTDTIIGPPYLYEIWRKDSMVFNGPEDAYLLDLPTFGIMPYNQFEYTSIQNLQIDEILISPNPFINNVTLQSIYQIKEITIYNLTNQLVYINQNINTTYSILNLEKLSSNAIYLMKILTDNGYYSIKLIKN
ncbi:MAG: T9SS type A sorting domain-containing protein [Bacteroidetes bacterium]|nr:T9SS type A sorting domain-containing protein [Bacteroidota bacterium]MBK7108938.1 T9SS type A sorting domain-containing protein [Bacteroidota bacterium]MBP7397981.1 T9SS type A sorting domain-containing protein [Chitinophagales bacterium]MBP8754806.1 T9SS type A sorting domain-containing protein [Chitinophagales bacterium]MBP9188322.1 T9SS type A sorting domain-containing protein [Chitinophagales bacterium]